jgi:hypothetical protein
LAGTHAAPPGVRGAESAGHCFDDGILIRSSGDTLVLSTPEAPGAVTQS